MYAQIKLKTEISSSISEVLWQFMSEDVHYKTINNKMKKYINKLEFINSMYVIHN